MPGLSEFRCIPVKQSAYFPRSRSSHDSVPTHDEHSSGSLTIGPLARLPISITTIVMSSV